MNAEHLILATGVFIFAHWLLHTGLGRKSLRYSRIRRHHMSPLIPFIALFLWLGMAQLFQQALLPFTQDLDALLVQNLAMIIGGGLTSVLILIYTHFAFHRGLVGLGLRYRTIPRDFYRGGLTLLAVWPLVVAMLLVVMGIGKLIKGADYEVTPHPELQQLAEHPDVLHILAITFMATVMAPLSEELIFRGIIQSLLRKTVKRPWLAIVMTSMAFASVHGDPTHWPPLFVLSLGIGYSYEKSGSLWRPIFMHALFNGITVISNMLGG